MASLEIVDALQSIMEKDGTLGEVRAKLRANVINILSNENADPVLSSVSSYSKEEGGKIALSVVADFLTSLGMKSTLRVFEAESGIGEKRLSRDVLGDKLTLHKDLIGESSPLLDYLISGDAAAAAQSSSPGQQQKQAVPNYSSANSEKQASPSPSPAGKKKQQQQRLSNNSPTGSPESADARRSSSPHTLLPVEGGGKGLAARRAISLQISPKAEALPGGGGATNPSPAGAYALGLQQGAPPKSPTALSPMPLSPSAASAAEMRQNSVLGSSSSRVIPSAEARPRMGRDLAPLVPISSPTSSQSSPTMASTLGQKPSIFKMGASSEGSPEAAAGPAASKAATSPGSPATNDPTDSSSSSSSSRSPLKTNDASAAVTAAPISRTDPPSLGVEAGIIRDQKLSNAAKPLDPVSTNVVNVRSNSNKRAARGDATASRLSGSTTRASRGWGNDDRHDDADFEFGENDSKSAAGVMSPENPGGGGGSRRLSPLSSRNRSPPGSSPGDVNKEEQQGGGNYSPQDHQKQQQQQQQHPGSALEDLDDDDDNDTDNNKLEASMRSNQQDEDDYEDDYEDEFEEAADLSDLSPKMAPKELSSPAKSGSLFAKRSPGNNNNSSAADESGEDFEDAFDDSFGGDESDYSPAAQQDTRASSSNANGSGAKEKASWGTKGDAAVGPKGKDSSSPLQKEEAVVLQDLDESVASEDIEDFEVSVADNSDSFSFLNESMNSQRSKGGTTRSNTNSGKAALNTSQASEGSNVMDFSVTEHELSSSAATLGDFDHAVKALPPLRTQKK